MSQELFFVDAHIHLWDLKRLRYPWLSPPYDDEGPNGSVEAIARDYSPAEYLADVARWNMVGSVHIDAGAHPEDALGETRWLNELAELTGLPTAIVAFAALEDPKLGDALAYQAAQPRVRGIRHIVNWHQDARRTYQSRDLTADEHWRSGFALLSKFGLSFDLQCYPGQMPGLADLFAAHPDTPVIINHLGMPVLADTDGIEDWRRGLRSLAALPHVAIKLSGLGFIDRAWKLKKIRQFLIEAVDLFGPDRCMFASDAPTDKLFAPFDHTMEAFETFASTFTQEERHSLFGRTANRIYRLGLKI